MTDPSAWITLLTDFGYRDAYVGILKGVIAQIAPTAATLDLTHGIPPQDIALASWQLQMAASHFPPGTIHLVVVDPGVGSRRRAIALHIGPHFFIGPDNGVFTGVLSQHTLTEAVCLNHPEWWYTPTPSNSFHGRDIFAPVAAHLSQGVPLHRLGTPIPPDGLVRLTGFDSQDPLDVDQGWIQAIDHFGNLMTTLPAMALPPTWCLILKDSRIQGRPCYEAVPPGTPVALGGSHGYLEIAINGGNAQYFFQAQVGDRVVFQAR
jgi:hypothetical protein